jgi:parvulin-like peptidyl-prolyl isomerase
MKRSIAILTTAVLAVTLLSACGKNDEQAQSSQPTQAQPAENNNQASDPNDPLAKFPPVKLPFTVDPNAAFVEYQGGTLTGKEFETFLRTISFLNPQQTGMIEAADKEALKNYAREYTATKILASRADDSVNKESKALAETTFEKIKGQYISILGKDAAKFDKLMQNHGLTKEVVLNQMILINNSINVLKKHINDASVKKLYDEMDKSAFTVASVRHILISTEQRKPEDALKLAKELVDRLKKGEDFAKLAKEYTDDPGSKESGGLYADADVSQWVPEFKDAALTLPIGQISEPVKTDYGYHVMKVESRKQKSFDEVKDQLRQQALEQSYEKFINSELDKLITKYNIPEPKPAS